MIGEGELVFTTPEAAFETVRRGVPKLQVVHG